MNIQIRSKDARVSDGMREYINSRMARIEKVIDHIVDAQVELRTEKFRSGSEFTTAQVTLQTGKHIIRAEVRESDASKAIDQAIEKLERQARKFRDRQKDRKGRQSVSNLSVAAVSAQSGVDDADSAVDVDEDGKPARVVRSKRFAMKPMDVDEAIDQLELLGHEFFLFLNSDEEQLNVVYRRRDGTYGTIAPLT